MNHIAAIQMISSHIVADNLAQAEKLIARAAQHGAKLCVLPENFASMAQQDSDLIPIAEAQGNGPIQDFLATQAARHQIWLVSGTIPLQGDTPNKVRPACLLYDDQGNNVACYVKIHLFDVSLTENQLDRYKESDTYQPGQQVVVADTPFGKLGLAICYDLRFPELFRAMVAQGAQLIALPAAFTAITGRAHWEVLVRARAVENQCFFIASGQGGAHTNGRETFGDTMIVDPWGVVISRLPIGAGVVYADIDFERQNSVRQKVPALEHRRFTYALK